MLYEVNLDNNRILAIHDGIFCDNVQLSLVKLNYNLIRQVGNKVFKNNYLSELHLKGNMIDFIQPSTFNKVRVLDISYNNLPSIGNIFSKYNIITCLDMSYNNIEFIQQQTLSTLKNVVQINMSYNKIVGIAKDSFDIPKLTHLNLIGNKVKSSNSLNKSTLEVLLIDIKPEYQS